jgi:hypothetical protein
VCAESGVEFGPWLAYRGLLAFHKVNPAYDDRVDVGKLILQASHAALFERRVINRRGREAEWANTALEDTIEAPEEVCPLFGERGGGEVAGRVIRVEVRAPHPELHGGELRRERLGAQRVDGLATAAVCGGGTAGRAGAGRGRHARRRTGEAADERGEAPGGRVGTGLRRRELCLPRGGLIVVLGVSDQLHQELTDALHLLRDLVADGLEVVQLTGRRVQEAVDGVVLGRRRVNAGGEIGLEAAQAGGVGGHGGRRKAPSPKRKHKFAKLTTAPCYVCRESGE